MTTSTNPTIEVSVRVVLRIVVDGTTDLASLVDDIDGRPCQVDVAGFRFDGDLAVDR